MPKDTKYTTIQRIIAEHEAAGKHFFSRGALSAFDSRIHSDVYDGPGGVYFVTSERFHGSNMTGPRWYNVRRYWPETGGITTAKHREFKTRRAAHKAAKELSEDSFNA